MGQILAANSEIDISQPVTQVGKLLTEWKWRDTLDVFKRFWRIPSTYGFFLSKNKLKELTVESPIDGLEHQIFSLFSKGTPPRINALEFLCAIVIYGKISWEQKVKLIMRLFDNDNDRALVRDEIVIMLNSSLNSISCMTKSPIPSNKLSVAIADQLMSQCSSQSWISTDELLFWTHNTREVYNLLHSYENLTTPTIVQLPPLLSPIKTRSLTPNKKVSKPIVTPKLNIKNLTPIRQMMPKQKSMTERFIKKPKEVYILVNGEVFTKSWALELKRTFKKLENFKHEVNTQAFGAVLSNIPLLESYANIIEDMSIIHEQANFQEILEVCCGGATSDQIKVIMGWIEENEAKMQEKIREKAQREAMKKLSEPSIRNLKRLFEIYDINRDGFIDYAELVECFKHIIEEEYLENVLRNFERDHEKLFDVQEFIRIMAPMFSDIIL
ncbi:unnamed protein product [Blepharisma stoltei]|uniref:EF-hand domain-containing protein n=1 Tax=Blepharisma stoltei TaxID=1481888 RepID=A0AAU9JDG6_9CILI|nr:unnamed protein product [Blepharisma stoltei]